MDLLPGEGVQPAVGGHDNHAPAADGVGDDVILGDHPLAGVADRFAGMFDPEDDRLRRQVGPSHSRGSPVPCILYT